MNTTVNWGVRLCRSRFNRLGESWYLSGGCTGQMKSLLFFSSSFFARGFSCVWDGFVLSFQ